MKSINEQGLSSGAVYVLKSEVHGNHLFSHPDLHEIASRVAKKSDKNSISFETSESSYCDLEIQEFKYVDSNQTFSGIINPTGEIDELTLYITGDFYESRNEVPEIESIAFTDSSHTLIDLPYKLTSEIRKNCLELILESEEYISTHDDGAKDEINYKETF